MLMVFVNICTVMFCGNIQHQRWVNKKGFRECMCPVIRVDVRVCVSTYTHTYMYCIHTWYVHTHIHTYIHTFIRT